MRLIEKLLGRDNAAQVETVGQSGSKTLPRESVFSGPPTRILKTEADVKKDDALLEMSQVVAEIEKDPDTNWVKYKGDFEKAVTGMRESFEPTRTREVVEAPSKTTLEQEFVDSGWKLSSRDKHALSIYEKHCKDHSMSPNPYDAGDWLKEFRGLDEESRQERIKSNRRSEQIDR